MAAPSASIPPPASLKQNGNMAADWERFRSEWNNYEIATDLYEKTNKKRAAVFLACIGSAAYSIFAHFSSRIRKTKLKSKKQCKLLRNTVSVKPM